MPQPVDVEDVVLPEELDVLVESLAKNVHEVWAQNRMSKGWVYGPERDDVLKCHPCILPYEKLTDQERCYDRSTAIATLKFIQKLGFKIVPPKR